MKIDLRGRSFLTLMDFSTEEIRYMLDLAHKLKAKKKSGRIGDLLAGKNIVLLFDKTSTRTRCSFEVAAMDEGAGVTFLNKNSSQFGKKESVEDSARVLGRFYDGIEYRGFEQSLVEDLAKYSGVPVWNGLTDIDHPTQILADMLTMEEHIEKPLNECKVVFCGDIRNNMSYAWMYGCAKMGIDFTAFGPDELEVDPEVLARAREVAAETGSQITVSSDVAAVKGADVLYTDVWASMGEEDQIPDRVRLLTPYKVTKELMDATGNPDVLFMHCLPAFHDFETQMASEWMEKGIDIREVTDEVFRSRNSVVFDEAENRMHSIKAVVVATMADDPDRD
ncbi:MAG: ornithine carbamoyltransferase [Firmicutes bacterium]|nr:ornithine carbamoyltransferase [Bacillota bacterium]